MAVSREEMSDVYELTLNYSNIYCVLDGHLLYPLRLWLLCETTLPILV